ncbi:MAG: hypothetical protein JWL73_1380 [Actinomycetia bacterium]|nr:hypothetical protein [Actinomycetes bacterium]
MKISEVLTESFDRVRGAVPRVVDGLDVDALTFRPKSGANSIAWLVWHLTRIQDDHVADLAGREQVWTEGGFAARFGLPFGDGATGYGQSSDDVAAVRLDAEKLVSYHDAVADRTQEFLIGVDESTLDRVVDRSWDPPVTEGVRLVSVVSDCLQHVGQAAYVRGLLP